MRTATRAATVAGTLALLVGSLSACAEDEPAASGGDGGGQEDSGCGQEVQIDELTQVGLAFDVGGRGDLSFNDLAVAGLEEQKEALGFETQELSPNADASNRPDLLRQLADGGYNPIIGVGFAYAGDIDTVAAEYPEVQFIGIDTAPSECANVASVTFAEHEGSFLVGAAAALESETGSIGFVGGNESALINKFYAGYLQGAEAVDPEIEVIDTRLRSGDDTEGFGDSAGGQVAATAMYENGADIVYHAAGGSGIGVFEAAAAAGQRAIGVDADQYNTVGDPRLQEVIMTSMLKRVDSAVSEALAEIGEGGTIPATTEVTLEQDGVGYSTTGGQIDGIVDQLEDYKAQIIAGDIEVSPTAP